MRTGDKIKMLREENHWTQGELAKKLELSRSCVANWEVHRTSPGNDELLKLSACFGVSIDEILGNKIPPKEEYISVSKRHLDLNFKIAQLSGEDLDFVEKAIDMALERKNKPS